MAFTASVICVFSGFIVHILFNCQRVDHFYGWGRIFEPDSGMYNSNPAVAAGWLKSKSAYIAVIALAFIPLFVNLGAYPIQLWDESRIAVSAFEMMNSGNYLVTTFEGTRDEWNTKPPLLVWVQVIFFHVFGVSEFVFRLPSALAGLGLFLGLIYFFRKLNGSMVTAAIAVLLLIISPRFVGFHALRTGDYEALLIFFLTMQVIHFYLHITESDQKKSMKHLTWMLTFVALAGLTKSVNGLFFTPVFAVWWIAAKQWKRHSFIKVALLSLASLGIIIAFYLMREFATPGYLKQVWVNDLGGRLSGAIAQDGFPNRYYWELFVIQTNGWAYLTPILVVPALFMAKKRQVYLLLYLLACSMGYYSVIHIAKTNTVWYNLAMLPLMAMLTAVSGDIIWHRLLLLFRLSPTWNKRLGYALFIPLIIPYFQTVKKTINQTEVVDKHESYYAVTNYLRSILGSPKKNWVFYSLEYSPHNWWYVMRMKDQGNDFVYVRDFNKIELNDTVICYEHEAFLKLDSMYVLDTAGYPGFRIVVPVNFKWIFRGG